MVLNVLLLAVVGRFRMVYEQSMRISVWARSVVVDHEEDMYDGGPECVFWIRTFARSTASIAF
jgi:hypothetical protein